MSEKLGIEIAQKAVGGDAKSMTSIKKYVETSIDMGFRRVIYDRHSLLSGPIYTSGLTRLTPNEGFDDFRWLSTQYSRWRELAPIVIICLPPFDEVWKNCQRHEDNKRLFPTKHKLASVYWLYFNLAARNPAMLLFDYTRHNRELMSDFILSALEARNV